MLGSARFHPRSWDELPDGRLVLEERVYDAPNGRHATRFLVIRPDGTRHELEFSLRAYTHPELASLLRRTGFDPVSVHGGWAGEEFTRETWRMIVTAQRSV